MRLIYFFLIGFLSFAAFFAEAEMNCTEIVSPLNRMDRLLESMGDTHSKLFKVLTGRMAHRWESSGDEGFHELQQKISNCKLGVCQVSVVGDTFEFRGSVTRIKKSIELKIDMFRLIVKNRNGERRLVKMGKRPKGLNVTFVNFIASAFSGINNQLVNDPLIESAKIKGSIVVNKHLVALLESYGFTSSPNSFPYFFDTYLIAMKIIGAYGTIQNQQVPLTDLWLSPQFAGYTAIFKSLTVLLGGAFHFMVGKNWTLELPINSPDQLEEEDPVSEEDIGLEPEAA